MGLIVRSSGDDKFHVISAELYQGAAELEPKYTVNVYHKTATSLDTPKKAVIILWLYHRVMRQKFANIMAKNVDPDPCLINRGYFFCLR